MIEKGGAEQTDNIKIKYNEETIFVAQKDGNRIYIF